MDNLTTLAIARDLRSVPSAEGKRVQRFIPLQSDPFWNENGQPTAVHACVLVKHRARQVLTAIRTLDNHLRLFSTRVNADGSILCTGSTNIPIDKVTQIDLVRAQKYVSACRTMDGVLHLQCWDVSNTGAIYPSGAAAILHNELEWFQLLVLAPNRLLTIGLSQDGQWHLISWAISDEGALKQLHQESIVAYTGSVAATTLQTSAVMADAPEAAPNQDSEPIAFATVMHSAPNQLRWTRWHCLPDGQLQIDAQIDQHHPGIVDLALTAVNGIPITLLHSATGQLQLRHDWPTIATSDRRRAAVTLADHVRLFTVTNDGAQLMIAHVTTPPDTSTTSADAENFTELTTVEMHRWQPTEERWYSCGSGVLPIATATELALCNQPLDGNAPFLTAIGTAAGALHLVTWGDATPAE